MARVVLTTDQIRAWSRREILDRSRRTLQIYRKQPLERDNPSYPFARHPEDASIRSPSSARIQPTRAGVTITVQSRGAAYIEGGNGPGDIVSNMAIPLRGRRKRSKGSIVVGPDGRAYLRVERVRSYRGQRLLEMSAREAFGLRRISRPPLH